MRVPKSIVSMMMAFGVPVECNVVRPMARGKSQCEFTGTVHHTSQSRKATQALKLVEAALGPNDAPVLVLCVSGWKDGFGPGKCKNNRN